MTSSMLRVSEKHPCPICHKCDWCLRAKDGTAAICARVESPRPIERRGRDRAGYLHLLSGEARVEPVAVNERARQPVNIDWSKLAASLVRELTPSRLNSLAASLGLTADSLTRLHVGWCGWQHSYSFPMRDSKGAIVGIRLRKPAGFKYCIRGSRSALFIPTGIESATLCIAEGPTDCAALLDMGLAAVGRPSCTGGISLLLKLVRRLRSRNVVIVADGDEPGRAGAKTLADELSWLTVELRIVTPPPGIKDAREWKQQGATAADVLSAPAIAFPHSAIRRARRHAIDHRRRQRT